MSEYSKILEFFIENNISLDESLIDRLREKANNKKDQKINHIHMKI